MTDYDPKVVGARIRTLRESRKWTRADLAALCDDQPNVKTIKRIENGYTRSPRLDTLRTIASVFQVTTSYLLTGAGEEAILPHTLHYVQYMKTFLADRQHRALYFASDGIKKIDIDFGKYIRRPEEDHLLHCLFTRKRHVVVGNAASGKTSLLRKLGHDLLAKGHFDVVFLNAAIVHHDNVSAVCTEIDRLHAVHSSSLIIIFEDLHRSFEPANAVAHHIITHDISCIFSSRPSYIDYTDVRIGNILLSLEHSGDVTVIAGDQVADGIIDQVQRAYGKMLSNEQYVLLNTISAGDLWILGHLLASFEHTGRICLEVVYDDVISRITALEGHTHLQLFRPLADLALVGRYEIPLSSKYCLARYGAPVINALLAEALIVNVSGMVSFYHSSIADIFSQSLQHAGVITNVGAAFTTLAASYMHTLPDSFPVFIKRLSLEPEALESLLAAPMIAQVFSIYLGRDDVSLSAIADLITDACRQGTNVIADRVCDALRSQLPAIVMKCDLENSIADLNFFIGSIPWLIRVDFMTNTADLSSLMEDRIRSGELAENQCIYHLPFEDPGAESWRRVPEILGESLTAEDLVSRGVGCSRFNNLRSATLCLKSVMCEKSTVACDILQDLDIKRLVEKIEQQGNPYEAIRLIHSLFWIHKDVALSVFTGTRGRLPYSSRAAYETSTSYRYAAAVAALLDRNDRCA